MEKHTVYIVTDSNRTYLEVGCCTDINIRLSAIRNASSALFGNTPKLSNVVYMAFFESKEKAEAHKIQLQRFTRMQREKLIRLKNPNWLNLYAMPTATTNKKVVVYA